MKIFIYFCFLISSAQAASTRRFPIILGVYADLVKESCGEVGGHIFEKNSTREGISKQKKLVYYDDPKFDEIAKEYDEIDKEYTKQLKMKVVKTTDSRVSQVKNSAQVASPNNSLPERGVYEDVIKISCGNAGGQIFEKDTSINGRIFKTRKLVCKNDPKIDEIEKEYSEQLKVKIVKKPNSRIGQEDSDIYKCKMVNKYLYCNNDHFYEKVGPVEDALLTRPSMDVFNSNRPKDKATDQFNKDKGMKNSSIIER